MDAIPIFNFIPQSDLAPQYRESSFFTRNAEEAGGLYTDKIDHSEKEWTVLSYIMHNNFNKMRQLEAVGTSDGTNVVSSFSRNGKDGTERSYYIVNKAVSSSYLAQENSVLVKNMGNQDFGDPKTLEDFLVWGIKNFPAKNYAVVMHNHGNIWMGGWRDFATENMMTLPEIEKVMENVKKRTGVKPNIIAMDACLMANIETAYQLRNSADFLVASEDMEFMQYDGQYAGMPLDKMLAVLPQEEGKLCLTPEEVAKKWVEVSQNNKGTPTLSAIRLSEAKNVEEKADNLARAILDSGISMDIIRNIVRKTKHFAERGEIKPFIYQHDIYDFAKNILSEISLDKTVKNAAAELCKAIDKAVLKNQNTGPNEEKAYGISVYIPYRKEGVERPQELLEKSVVGRINKEIKYQDLAFAIDSHWDELFTKLAYSDNSSDSLLKRLCNTVGQASTLVPGPLFRGIQDSSVRK